MSTEPSSVNNQSSTGCARGVLVLGCGCLVVLVAIVVAGVMWVPELIGQFRQTIAEASSQRDRLISEALAGGDAVLAYQRADERFRAQYTQDQLNAYFQSHPAVLNPPRMSVSLSSQTRNNQTVVHTSFELNDTRYIVYTTKDNDQYRLLGVSPDLAAAVPPEFREESGKFDPGADAEDDLGLEI